PRSREVAGEAGGIGPQSPLFDFNREDGTDGVRFAAGEGDDSTVELGRRALGFLCLLTLCRHGERGLQLVDATRGFRECRLPRFAPIVHLAGTSCEEDLELPEVFGVVDLVALALRDTEECLRFCEVLARTRALLLEANELSADPR